MTKFELQEDYRTAAQEALRILRLDRCDIHAATSYHELLANLPPEERKVALAAVEVYKMFRFRERTDRIFSGRDAYEAMKSCMTDLTVEECWVILLNQSDRIIRKVRVSVGGIDATVADVRIIMKEVITASATAFVLVHNHPGGSLLPSPEDDRLTGQLKRAAQIMNVKLMDHILFTDNGFYSYGDNGKL